MVLKVRVGEPPERHPLIPAKRSIQHNNTMTFFAVLIIFCPFRFLGTVYGLSFLFMPEQNISALICLEYYLHASTSMDSPKISIAFT